MSIDTVEALYMADSHARIDQQGARAKYSRAEAEVDTVPFLESGPISAHGPCFTGSGEIRPAPWPICRPKGPSNSEEAAGLARIGF